MMTLEKSGVSSQTKSLLLWPGVIIVTLQWLIRYLLPAIAPKAMVIGVSGGVLGGVAIAVWWLFFSRVARIDRWGAIILIIASLSGTFFLLDESIATANMGLMFIMYSIPVMCLAFVIWAAASRHLSIVSRRTTMVLTIILASAVWIFLRTNGMTGDGRHNLGWRWAETSENRLLAQSGTDSFEELPDKVTSITAAEWPGFRGPNRDGIVNDLKIRTDWSVSPPVEMWRRSVGPGCSSFAVNGNLLYTQEQLGENEIVSCYDLTNGNPVWKHRDKARFYESHAGPGPRSTPTLAGDRICTIGATGIINVLDAMHGSVIWSRNAASDAGIKVPGWGFAGSPLVAGDVVIVALAGKMAAYDIASGNPRWFGPDGGSGYSSPQLLTLNGIPQVLFMSKTGAISVESETGEKLWDYQWEVQDRILQPSYIEGGDLLLSGENKSICRVSVKKETDGYKISELWNSSDYKVNFNDFVISKEYAYGFDGPSLTCIDLRDGRRMWRGDRYRGFQILLADQDLLVILTEKGEVVLVPANPDKFTELAGIQALNAKTWSHPVIAGDILVVRNAEEMAAFRLPLKE